MANDRDTDRMAGDLMKALLGSLNKPAAGTGQPQSAPQVDENSMLDTIKGFLNQSLPGTKEREKPNAPAAPHVNPVVYQSAATAGLTGGWERLFRRQGQEREAMHGRHERERAEMHQRHVQELEASVRGLSSLGGVGYGSTTRRNAPTIGPTRVPPGRGHIRGIGAG